MYLNFCKFLKKQARFLVKFFKFQPNKFKNLIEINYDQAGFVAINVFKSSKDKGFVK